MLDFSAEIKLNRRYSSDTFANLSIVLRGDCVPVMNWIRTTTGVGTLVKVHNPNKSVAGGVYRITNNQDCLDILKAVLPHLKNAGRYTQAKYLLDYFPLVSKQRGRYNKKQTEEKLNMEKKFNLLLK